MKSSLFDYDLPKELIAQKPISPRDQSRLLILNQKTKTISHHKFFEPPDLIDDSYVLVFNNTRVLPFRIFASRPSGGKIKMLFLQEIEEEKEKISFFESIWKVLIKGKIKIGQKIILSKKINFKVLDFENGVFKVKANISGKNF